MAPSHSSPPAERPPPIQFIIALLLSKSKPSNLSRQEYFNRLRSYIRTGRRSSSAATAANHIDTTLYWKTAYDESKNIQTTLRDRIFELETELDKLKNEKGSAPSSAKKRKRSSAKVASAPTASGRKQAKATASPPPAKFQDPIPNSAVHEFLHCIYMLQQAFAKPTHGPEALTGPLCCAASAFCRVIANVQLVRGEYNYVKTDLIENCPATRQERAISYGQCPMKEEVGNDVNAIKNSFPTLLRGLDILSQLPGSTANENRIIYSFIQIFQCLLQRICGLATDNALKWLNQPGNEDWAMHVCELTISMVKSLHMTKAPHKRILEGFLCLLFKKIGEGLRHIVFGSEEESPGQPNNVKSAGIIPKMGNHGEEDNGRMGAEGPYFVWILERAQAYASGRGPSTVTYELDVQDISRKKFQNTLLKAVFRERAATDFEPSLVLHTPTSAELSAKDLPQAEVDDWFKHEIWRIVGWDVLRNQLGGAWVTTNKH